MSKTFSSFQTCRLPFSFAWLCFLCLCLFVCLFVCWCVCSFVVVVVVVYVVVIGVVVVVLSLSLMCRHFCFCGRCLFVECLFRGVVPFFEGVDVESRLYLQEILLVLGCCFLTIYKKTCVISFATNSKWKFTAVGKSTPSRNSIVTFIKQCLYCFQAFVDGHHGFLVKKKIIQQFETMDL